MGLTGTTVPVGTRYELRDAAPLHHEEGSVAVHTRMVLEALQQQPEYRALPAQEQEILWAAALLHDVEKRSTSVDEGGGIITSKGHARRGEYTARTILYRDIPTPFHIRENIAALVRYHGLPVWIMERENPVKSCVKHLSE